MKRSLNMFDRIARLAEQTATSLSRRKFLTRLGLGAAALLTFASTSLGDHNCVLNGNGCGGAYPYYNRRTGRCCSDSTCATCKDPNLISCVLNGGCCGGIAPYLKTYTFAGQTKYVCCSDPACGTCVLCANSTSCHGGGYCLLGLTSCSDSACNTPCV